MSHSVKLDPLWCEVQCPSCCLTTRILILGWQETHGPEEGRGAWIERDFESEEFEECVCGAAPEDLPLEELAFLYDRTAGAEEPHGWLTSTKRRRK